MEVGGDVSIHFNRTGEANASCLLAGDLLPQWEIPLLPYRHACYGVCDWSMELEMQGAAFGVARYQCAVLLAVSQSCGQGVVVPSSWWMLHVVQIGALLGLQSQISHSKLSFCCWIRGERGSWFVAGSVRADLLFWWFGEMKKGF